MSLYCTKQGSGTRDVLFLHGLWGGGNYFRVFDWFETDQVTAYFPDELGFGLSPKPLIPYAPEVHCQALRAAVPTGKRYTIIGHSFGSILAVHFAKQYPDLVEKLVLISPLIYATRAEARHCLKRTGMLRLTLEHPKVAQALCKTVCSTGILGVVSPYFTRGHKKRYIKGCTLHTWQSYYSSVINCIVAEPTALLLQELAEKVSVYLYTGDKDPYLAKETFTKLSGLMLEKTIIPNQGHNLLFTEFEQSKDFINQAVLT